MPAPLAYQAFLFDLDGTLIDHFAAIDRSYTHALAHFGRPAPTRERVRSAVGGGVEHSIAQFFPPENQAEATRVYRAYWDRTMLDDVELMPGARELLAGLHARGARLGVVSNKLGSSSRLICEHLGLQPYLQAVIGAKDTPWLKPDLEFTRHVLAVLGAETGSTLLVGDSPYDIQAAHVAGLPAWCVSQGTHNPDQLRAAGADRIFGGLPEVGRGPWGFEPPGCPAMSAPAAQSLTGVVERIIFLNEENHYTIAELRPEAGPGAERTEAVTVVGTLPGVECGETLHLTGDWTRHALHGAQFKIAGFRSELQASVYGIRKYLGSGLVAGIGKVYANKIVDAFGTDTFRILSEDSGQLRHVPGIGRKRAAAIKQAWDGKRAERELYIFLQTYGVTPGQCLKLVSQYGTEAKAVLLREPYRVAREIDGIGFKTADRIAINLGFANDAPPRLDAGILYALETLQEEGHTAYPEKEFTEHAAALLETTQDRIAARIEARVAGGSLIRQGEGGAAPPGPPVERGGAGGPALPEPALIQLPVNALAERAIARAVFRLHRGPSGLPPIKVEPALAWAEARAGFVFHELQRGALRHALGHKLSILTGGPGTGKTTILRALVEILKFKKVRVHLAAPTGRAAQRLAETTGGSASTLHRLLKFDPARGAFTANQDHPLATDFLIVDEASMIDTRLAAALFLAVPSRAHLVLVGDVDQLPSVGAGNVLKDLIAAAEAPVSRLSVIYRQQGQSPIVITAHAINSGDPSLPPAVPEVAAVPPAADLAFITASSAEDCLRKVVELCAEHLPRHFPRLDPIKDVQVLAPMHKGVAGVSNLNVELQAALNGRDAPGRDASGRDASPRRPGSAFDFRPGDKIIQLRNNYDKNLFNGDIGRVTAFDPSPGLLTAEFDGEVHSFTRGEAGDLALAYAISLHKSQGSEYPIVVIPLLKAHFLMLQRNLLYTGITRGRRKVFLVGEPAAYAMAVRNQEAKERITHLRQKLAAQNST